LDNTKLDRKLTRSALGFQKGDIILGFIASFHQVKHQMNMIGAMEEIIKVNPKIKLAFVGNVGHANYFQKVKVAWEKSSAQQNIIHIPFISHSQLGEFLRESVDIFILPTIQEGCSNAVIDALYCGKPMLLTNVGNASDLAHLKSVVVVDRAFDDLYSFRQSDIDRICLEKKSRNNREIVKGILEIAEGLEDYKQAAQDAAKLYASQCDKSTMAERYLELIKGQSTKLQ
jgi:glycosyltransferase involved in cell wall biosynthesis